MVATKTLVKGLIGHIFLLLVNFSVLVGIIESLNLFEDGLSLLNFILLSFMLVHTFILLTIQLGIQILEIIKVRPPTVLVTYYFEFGEEETIPLHILDPIKSKLAVIVLLLVITGGVAFYPIFAVYGFLLVWGHLAIIALDPSQIVRYFGIFLNWMPPVILIVGVVIVFSILAIEFRHV
ncbi:MAG: hypothetical protein DRO87_02635 [Candidatus Thorarchaeota archaeon]|nr:MAG: hypothetical protein DRP09_10050 [Candidatus Thorarchaeota archaeon]RLI59509.1 MAG: hypothetical protein DRO87_02635 [Candidatus Thorarchaeota archaeon]